MFKFVLYLVCFQHLRNLKQKLIVLSPAKIKNSMFFSLQQKKCFSYFFYFFLLARQDPGVNWEKQVIFFYCNEIYRFTKFAKIPSCPNHRKLKTSIRTTHEKFFLCRLSLG